MTSLFDLPPHNATDTSTAAALAIRSKTKEAEMELLTWLRYMSGTGGTDSEIQERFGWSGDFERPRRWRLAKDGMIQDSGRRRTTPSGKAAIVWVVS